MAISRKIPRVLLIFLINFAFGASAFSQRPNDLTSAPATVVIDGAANPELISQEALFLSLSGLLESSGPGNCSNDTQITGLSAAGACLRIDGIDMAKARQLVEEFRARSNEISTSAHAKFCGQQRARRTPYMSREEFAAEFENLQEDGRAERANFFVERGNALLGREAMSRLVAWANANLRRGIREVKVDFAGLMERRDLSPEQYAEELCSRDRQ
jgi:hypothetical protein